MSEMQAGSSFTNPSSEIMVSVVVANYCAASYLQDALRSILSQSIQNIEVLVVDDASTDHSMSLLLEIQAYDSRVRIIASEKNGGPGAARNKALRVARGTWIAIVDSDDIIRADRFEQLLLKAKALNSDAIADDLVFFPAGAQSKDTTLLQSLDLQEPLQVDTEYFIKCNTHGSGLPSLGYLKPIFKRSAIDGFLYRENLPIGEDYEFLLQFLLQGCSFHIVPDAFYLYRRHPNSISHRLSEDAVLAMIESQRQTVSQQPNLPKNIVELLNRRMAALKRSLQFERLISALKTKQLLAFTLQLFSHPYLVAPLWKSTWAHLKSRWPSSSTKGHHFSTEKPLKTRSK